MQGRIDTHIHQKAHVTLFETLDRKKNFFVFFLSFPFFISKMKEKQILDPIQPMETTTRRWKGWIVFFIGLTSLFYMVDRQDAFVLTNSQCAMTSQRPSTVLHSGFPPIDNVTGLTILPGKAAAIAFEPNPAVERLNVMGGESWWDRLFPNRHVHLHSVQVPILSARNQTISAVVSICSGEGGRLTRRKRFPDMQHCVSTKAVEIETEPGDTFGVLEWEPEVVIVLKKSTRYWLVLESPSVESSFEWVYAEQPSDVTEGIPVAIQGENGWQMQLKDTPPPSAIVMVERHF